MPTPLRVLILEDRPSDAELMVHELRRAGFGLDWRRVDTEADYLAHLDPAPDVILADYNLPQFDAPRAMEIVQGRGLDIPFIIVTGSISEEVAVESMKRGASDYLLKDRLTRLGSAVTQALERKKLRDEQRGSEARIRHLNDVLRAVSEVNQLIVRERSPVRLLVGVCTTLMQTRGYRLVWIGYVNTDHKRVVPVARAGEGVAFLDDIVVTWDESPTGQGPTGVAIRTRKPAFCQDILNDPCLAPWRKVAQARGYASAAAVPLFLGERMLGALSVYADCRQAFDEEEIRLLNELAEDLTFALRSIEVEQERKRAEEETKSAARFPAENPDPVLRLSHDGTILYANEASGPLVQSWGSKAGSPAPPSWRKLVREVLGSRSRKSVDIGYGKLWYSITLAPFPDAGYVNAYARDITQRKQAEAGLAEHVTQLEAVRAVNVELARELDLTVLLRLIVEQVTGLVGTTLGTCFLWDEAEQHLRPQAWIGYDEWRAETRLRLGEGMAGQAAQRREGLLSNDYPAEPYADPHVLARKPIRASMAEPLLYREQLIGVLTVDHDRPGVTFTPSEQQLLRLFAAQAAIAIENARLYDTALRRERELQALLVATRSVMSGLDLQAILERIASEAARISGCPHVKLILVDPDAGLLRVAVLRGRAHAEGFPLPIGVGLSGQVAETGVPLFVTDTQNDPRSALADQDRALGIRTYLGLPIKTLDKVLGVLTFNTTAPHTYTPGEMAYLASFADQAAVALEHAQQHAAARARADELEALQEIAQAMMARLDLPVVLEAVVAGACRLLASDFAQLVLWDEATGQLQFGAARGPEAERVKAQVFILGRGINGVVAQQRKPMLLNDYATSPYAVPECTDVVATITVPICFGDRLLGVLHSHSTIPGSRYTREDLRRLQRLAGQAAVAIENARLFEEVQRHASVLEDRVQERTRDLEAANDQLQTASRHKSEFLANMSHELRTPLNSVLGFAQILLEQTPELLSAKHTRFLTHIYTSGQHLLQLINDILDLSKVEAGKFVLQPEPLPVAATVEDILVIARGLANKKGQRIESAIAPGLPPLSADPVRVKQILFNLLSNAVKFTPAGGAITVTAHIAECGMRNAELSVTDPVPPSEIRNPKSAVGDFLEIAVTDTGIGIQEADLPRLFQEFVQLESSATKQHEGTGLGLALTKRLVELHGGRIWATSEGEGRGSTFTVVLPFGGPSESPKPAPAIQTS